MSDSINRPKWYLPACGIALLWNLLGLMAFFMQVTMTEEMIAALPAEESAFYANIPMHVTIAFAVATLAGCLGCVLLLMRKSLSFPVLVISLIAVMIQFSHTLKIIQTIEVFDSSKLAMPAVVVVVSCLLAFFSWHAKNRGWFVDSKQG